MELTITPIYAAGLGLMMIGLSMYVSSLRANQDVSIGIGTDPSLLERIRRHGNFVENVPMVLLLIAMAELTGLSDLWVHVACLILVVSRVIQPIGMRHDKTFTILRLAGNLGTFAAILIPAGYLIVRNFV